MLPSQCVPRVSDPGHGVQKSLRRSVPKQVVSAPFEASPKGVRASVRAVSSPAQSLPSAPAALRNREPILAVLKNVLGPSGTLLEVASGLGDHAAHFAQALPGWTVQPSDVESDSLSIVQARVEALALPNLRPPVVLDASSEAWPVEHADVVWSANMIHISPFEATEGLFLGAARVLPRGGLLITYGPYSIDGKHTAPSNAEFDASLRQRDPRWGVRDLSELERVARVAGFELERREAMPANNFTLVFRLQAPADPSKDDLLAAEPGSVDTDALRFVGRRGDASRHLSREELVARLRALPPAPRERGTVELLVARGTSGQRLLHPRARLTRQGGMPGDRWVNEDRYGPEFQLATTQSDYARVVANGQPLELHGDNLFLHLDLSAQNLPVGSTVRLGQALLRVTPQAHNGCKKWVQRFGLAPMKLNLDPDYRHLRLRGIYFQVIEDGDVSVGDAVSVVTRA